MRSKIFNPMLLLALLSASPAFTSALKINQRESLDTVDFMLGDPVQAYGEVKRSTADSSSCKQKCNGDAWCITFLQMEKACGTENWECRGRYIAEHTSGYLSEAELKWLKDNGGLCTSSKAKSSPAPRTCLGYYGTEDTRTDQEKCYGNENCVLHMGYIRDGEKQCASSTTSVEDCVANYVEEKEKGSTIYEDGENGKNGKNGENGKSGKDGKDGDSVSKLKIKRQRLLRASQATNDRLAEANKSLLADAHRYCANLEDTDEHPDCLARYYNNHKKARGLVWKRTTGDETEEEAVKSIRNDTQELKSTATTEPTFSGEAMEWLNENQDWCEEKEYTIALCLKFHKIKDDRTEEEKCEGKQMCLDYLKLNEEAKAVCGDDIICIVKYVRDRS